jgi:hypothetical protein
MLATQRRQRSCRLDAQEQHIIQAATTNVPHFSQEQQQPLVESDVTLTLQMARAYVTRLVTSCTFRACLVLQKNSTCRFSSPVVAFLVMVMETRMAASTTPRKVHGTPGSSRNALTKAWSSPNKESSTKNPRFKRAPRQDPTLHIGLYG